MMCPDSDQQAIINIEYGRHLVLAPPGCGKTFILAERVVRAHSRGVAYEDMLCLTFTNRASRGMRERIGRCTNNPIPQNLFVGNVHRFCSNYLFDKKKIPQNSAVIDDPDAESIITYLARLDPQEDHSRYAADIVNLQHALTQREAGMPQRLIVHADLLADDDAKEAEEHYQSKCQLAHLYAQYKDEDCLIDFEDLLEKTYLNALEDPDRPRYRWIQVDEVQDISLLQLAIIDLFAAEDATIVYLGDEQQAIFSFVGAKMQALEQLREECATNLHHLGKNHRSPRYLLNLFNRYAIRQLGINPDLLPVTDNNQQASPQDLCLFRSCYHQLNLTYNKELLRCRYDDTACTRCMRSISDEYRLAVQLAQRYAAMGSDERVAIIVSTNADADGISKAFGDTPHFKVSGRDLFSMPTVQLLFSHLNVVANETCFIAWARLLYHLQVVSDYAEARNLMRSLRAVAISPTDLLMYTGTTYLQQFVHILDNEEIVLFDTETTGLDIYHDDIIQIAAIKVREGKMVPGSAFDIILETNKEIPPIVGGHDNPMLSVYLNSDRMGRAEGLSRFLEYCEGHILFGHNVEYDYNILDFNLRRTLGRGLGQRKRFDTLKLARLVEPRLRAYKLERLLETLHLEGENSHNAIDDVKATLSLLTYCRQKAEVYLAGQRQLLMLPALQAFATRFRDIYRDIYQYAHLRLYAPPHSDDKTPILVQELQRVYRQWVSQRRVPPVDKWSLIINFLSEDMIDMVSHPTLREQLDRYMVEINTLRESDLCDSNSMRQLSQERFFIATAHKAKGLEFETVIIFNATEGVYPHYNNIKDDNDEGIREDARRFYVAMSRAKRHLCILYAATNNRFQTNRPSPFLSPIADLLTPFAFNPTTGRVEQVDENNEMRMKK